MREPRMEWIALHDATKQGHAGIVALLLEQGADVNALKEYGGTALHEAAEEGHESIVALLLEQGADVNALKEYGGTALHEAALRGHTGVVTLLLEQGVDVNALDEKGRTALHGAARGGHESIVALLLEKGARPVQSESMDEDFARFLTEAKIVSGTLDVEVVKQIDAFLKSGANPNVTFDRGAVDDMTPLRLSVVHGHTDLVRLLLQAGADVNVQNEYGETVLHQAAWQGHASIVALLLEQGADVNVQNEGWSDSLSPCCMARS